MVDGALAASLRLLLPARCSFCDAGIAEGLACAGCLAALPWNRSACPICALPQPGRMASTCANCLARPPAFDRAWSAFRHEAPVAQAIHGLKYRAQFRQARLLGLAMAEAIAQRPQPLPELMLPVPLHASRLRRRGYNQALELARVLASRLAIELLPSAATRLRATPDQIGQRAAERRRSVRGAFAVDARVAGRHLVIVDDVMTTGSTVAELARVCRKAGAATVEVWTATRAV